MKREQRERDAATAREAVAREVLRPFAAQMTMDPHWEPDDAHVRIQVTIGDLRKARAALATPSPAAEALLELAAAAGAEADAIWLKDQPDGAVEVEKLGPTYRALYLATRKWQRARG